MDQRGQDPAIYQVGALECGCFFEKRISTVKLVQETTSEYFYSKKDLIALGEELTKRNIDLKRYRELVEDKDAFERKISALKKRKFQMAFSIPEGLENIMVSEMKMPDPEIIHADLARLNREFEIGKLGGYIDIHQGTHAKLRVFRAVEKYLEPGLKRRCRLWCDQFNYACRALELTTGKK